MVLGATPKNHGNSLPCVGRDSMSSPCVRGFTLLSVMLDGLYEVLEN